MGARLRASTTNSHAVEFQTGNLTVTFQNMNDMSMMPSNVVDSESSASAPKLHIEGGLRKSEAECSSRGRVYSCSAPSRQVAARNSFVSAVPSPIIAHPQFQGSTRQNGVPSSVSVLLVYVCFWH